MTWTPASLLAPAAPAADWRATLAELEGAGPFALAVHGGRRAASIGQAFAFGYQGALRALLPQHAPGRVAALCATEAGGNHPRAIQTRLADGRLTGEKTFVSMGPLAELLVVIARVGEGAAGRPRLVACLVDAGGEGVRVDAMPALPVVPDVPHGQLSLSAAPAVELPGDGYTGALKPFRTIEDIHVHAALSAWLLGVARAAAWPDDVRESLLVGVAALAQAAALDPTAPGTHLLLGGALSAFGDLVQRIEPLWADAPDDLREMWTRDRALMRIASKARHARLERARSSFGT